MEPRHPDHAPPNSDSSSSHPRRPSTSQRVTPNEDISWLDFLRSAGGTVPGESNSTSSSDRKRRHTGTQEPQRRAYPYPVASRRPSGMSDNSGDRSANGANRDNPVDLTTPPRPRPSGAGRPEGTLGGSRRSSSNRRRESDMVLPKWQPDSEVARCPVCQTLFSFWFRKHHCRKCGRVVCAACSPHRITIPRQYIVQPPSMLETEFGIRPEPESPVSRALGGGEVVRVCNPCVPDPWTPETAPASRGGRDSVDVPARPLIDGARNATDLPAGERSDRYRYVPPPTPAGGRHRSASHQPNPTPFSTSIPGRASHPNAGAAFRDHRHTSVSSRPSGYHRYTQSSSHLPPIPALASSSRPSISSPVPTAARQPRPRREVKEEDECPVCGVELPPGEAVRESHVQQCIAERFSSTPSSSARPPPPLVDSTVPPPSGPSTPPAQRPRATSYRPRGMALYKATEKDCTTEDGEPQECVICFEEFETGDEMGRMECLCKFHRHCIRAWWEKKGVGSCPTHQLHE